MASRRNGKVSYACFVTTCLYALSLPPTTPFWITAVGAIIAVLFGKEVFGGFGKNVFNPAIVGRAFVFVCFPTELTSAFVPVFRGFPGGFARWSFQSLHSVPGWMAQKGLAITDAITAATPMWARRDFGHETGLLNLFLGNIGSAFETAGRWRVCAAGSSGEVCAAVILCAGVYLAVTKTAQWRLMLAAFSGAAAINVLLRTGMSIGAVPPLAFTLFSGALAYAAVFMVTDPVSAPKQPLTQWIYGFFIGAMIVVFRFKGIFAGGAGFAILLGNCISPSLDI
jgi:Na+-transporting NADH:ubiquinone oxidoreductase subunit B